MNGLEGTQSCLDILFTATLFLTINTLR